MCWPRQGPGPVSDSATYRYLKIIGGLSPLIAGLHWCSRTTEHAAVPVFQVVRGLRLLAQASNTAANPTQRPSQAEGHRHEGQGEGQLRRVGQALARWFYSVHAVPANAPNKGPPSTMLAQPTTLMTIQTFGPRWWLGFGQTPVNDVFIILCL